ncbi:MAG: hypothetical protein LUG61_09985 [Lachnospiraceae bacterium]|nr:hypothetical protein [Lachnospiraceae bacterium]
MAGNDYGYRRYGSTQVNTRANSGRNTAGRTSMQYQYGTAVPKQNPTRRQTAQQTAEPARRRTAANQAAPARRQTAQQTAEPVRRRTSQQAAPARRQAPQRHQVDVGTEKARVTLKASPVNRLALVTVTAAFLFLGLIVLRYLSLQSDITQLRTNIQSLESEVNDLTVSNDEYLSRIEASVDLEDVREVAIMDLGMVYATEDQIITYDSQIDDYMEQSVVVSDED